MLVQNRKSRDQMVADLDLFLEDKAPAFTDWLIGTVVHLCPRPRGAPPPTPRLADAEEGAG